MADNSTEKRKKVLVVEDDKLYASIYQKNLTIENVDVKVALDGVEALELMRETKPDLILLDLIMPRMNGFEFMKIIKADPKLKDVKVVVLTNLGQDEDKNKALELGAVDFAIKSNVTFDEITATVKKHLGI